MKVSSQLVVTTVTALIAIFGAGAAIAQEATPDTWIGHSVSAKSRALVQAELRQARRDGSIKSWSAGFMPRVETSKSRDEVRAQVAAARTSGELAALNSEVYAYREPAVLRIAQVPAQ